MKKTLALGSLMFAAVLLLPDSAPGQKKDRKNAATPATAQEYAKLNSLREITGKIVFADESSKTITLRIEVPQVQANQNKNPQAKGRNKGRPNPFRINPYQVVYIGKDFELEVENKVTVQRRFITVEYDDKGFVKNNQEEAGVLRAKGYLPAKYEEIKSGMVAKLYLNAAKAGEDMAKPTVRMIVLLQSGAGPLQQAGAPPKKKDQ